jgi:hypothetical protein
MENQGYRKLYIFDELDNYISRMHGLTLERYIQLVENIMTKEDATVFINLTIEDEIQKSGEILGKYRKEKEK